MFANYKIRVMPFVTASTINIPINLEYQVVDNSELVETLFVETEKEKAINKILDYEKINFIPVDNLDKNVGYITYNLNFLNTNNILTIPTFYSDILIDSDDIKFRKNYFKQSFVNLSFYDTDNVMTQTLVTEIDIYSTLSKNDFYSQGAVPPNIPGQLKPANLIPVRYEITDPSIDSFGFYEGYYLYTYKNEYVINEAPKSLYMRATYFNAKTGKFINMVTEPSAYKINTLINKLHTKYDLFRNTNGYYYTVDTSYSNNVSFSTSSNPNLSDLSIKLYQIQSL